jgi:hypothetical protein
MNAPTWLDYVLAFATVASAAVIAWQAWQTRSAVNASNETAVAARESVEVANEALRESQLARIESGVPRLFVTTSSYVDSDWHRVSKSSGIGYDDFDHLLLFKLPRDSDRVVFTRHQVRITNDGPGSVNLKSSEPLRDADGKAISMLFPPGSSKEVLFNVSRSVKDWVKLSESEESSPVAFTLKIEYHGPRDADVSEYHDVVVRGSILNEVADARGDWHVPEDAWLSIDMTAEALPSYRKYWRSRSQGVEF